MNRIVRENYPVADLPEDLREGGRGTVARVTVEFVEPLDRGGKKAFAIEELLALSPRTFETTEEIAHHLRSLREEWN